MRKNTPAIYSLLFLLICAGCKNAGRHEEAINVDCQTMVKREDLANPNHFELNQHFVIENEGKSSVKLNLRYSAHNEYKADDGPMMFAAFFIDSTFSAERNSLVTLNFADNTNFTILNYTPKNSRGIILTEIGYESINKYVSKTEAAADLAKIKAVKIHDIVIETNDGKKDYVLTDTEASNLLQLVNCLVKAE